jgi:hypothetical protein
LDFEGHGIQHLDVRGADGRSKRNLHCCDYFHCIGFGLLGGIDSDFWLVAVATCYYPDDGLLFEFSIVLEKIVDVFGGGV